MATSGTINSGSYNGKYVAFNWWRSGFNKNTGKMTISWSISAAGATDYYNAFMEPESYLNINGNRVVTVGKWENGYRTAIWPGHATRLWTNLYGDFSAAYIKGDNFASGSFEITAGSDGTASFSVYGDFCWYTYGQRRYINTTVTVDSIKPSVGTPGWCSIPSYAAPDQSITASWASATYSMAGSSYNVDGYRVRYVMTNAGGTVSYGSWITTSSTSYTFNLNNLGFGHNYKIQVQVEAYTTFKGSNVYSSTRSSSTTDLYFVAPGTPRSLNLVFNTEEPIPTATYTASWIIPSSTGTNGIGGYTVYWQKNGNNYNSDIDVGNVTSNAYTLTENYAVGDTISFKVRAYTIGQGNKYYSSYVTSGTITIVSDKFIFVSINNGAFDKHKMYVSVNGGAFKEVKKNKFKVI